MRNAYAQAQHLLSQQDGTTSMRLELGGGVCLLREAISLHVERIRGAWYAAARDASARYCGLH